MGFVSWGWGCLKGIPQQGAGTANTGSFGGARDVGLVGGDTRGLCLFLPEGKGVSVMMGRGEVAKLLPPLLGLPPAGAPPALLQAPALPPAAGSHPRAGPCHGETESTAGAAL